jgi:hypothetical protein
MSSKFANRRKPRKIGGDEEDEGEGNGVGAAPGLFLYSFTTRHKSHMIQLLTLCFQFRARRQATYTPESEAKIQIEPVLWRDLNGGR